MKQIKEHKRIIGITVMVLMLASCAAMMPSCTTLQLGDNATQEQKQAARCEDAMKAKAWADANLAVFYPNGPDTSAAAKYFLAYQVGSQLGVQLSCGK